MANSTGGQGKHKGKYLVLRDELAPGESFEASTKPEFGGLKMDQEEFPESVVPHNPDGPSGYPKGK